MLNKAQKHAWKGVCWRFRLWKNRVWNWWYEFKCWLSPYNVVRCKTLPNTWCDRDALLLHSMFQILCDYMEKEHPDTHWYWNEPDRKKTWEELNALYKWWTTERPCRHYKGNHPKYPDKYPEEKQEWSFEDSEAWFEKHFKPIEGKDGQVRAYEWINSDEFREQALDHWNMDKIWRYEDKVMMHRLIEISDNLWT